MIEPSNSDWSRPQPRGFAQGQLRGGGGSVVVRRHLDEYMESPFICDMTAMTEEQRARHHALAKQLRPAVIEFKELPDGYAARFPLEPEMVLLVAEFITLERLCCACFTLGLEVEKERGPLWLKVTSREGIKPFIRAEFGIQ
ncbi:MAG: hypothetical protein ACE5E0_06520 [Terriglobia bacterium]